MFMIHRQLARWGERAVATGLGIEEYHESTRDIHDFGRRVGQLPEQRETDGNVDYRPLLHRDGSVLSSITLEVGIEKKLSHISHLTSHISQLTFHISHFTPHIPDWL